MPPQLLINHSDNGSRPTAPRTEPVQCGRSPSRSDAVGALDGLRETPTISDGGVGSALLPIPAGASPGTPARRPPSPTARAQPASPLHRGQGPPHGTSPSATERHPGTAPARPHPHPPPGPHGPIPSYRKRPAARAARIGERPRRPARFTPRPRHHSVITAPPAPSHTATDTRQRRDRAESGGA
jgi:hypothetical protein